MANSQWYDADNPDVSVIVVNFNRAELTKQCVEAIWENTADYKYEVIIVDNGSSADDVARLAELSGRVKIEFLAENRHFGFGCNLGAGLAKGRDIVFLNNDTCVQPNWLAPLVDVLRDFPEAGAVGSRMVYPDGGIQEAGGFISRDGAPIQVGAIPPYHPDEEFQLRVVDYCSAAALAVPAELFHRLGGFDPAFAPAYYEDVDLCFKIAATGKFVFYCPQSTVVHIKNATSLYLWSPSELNDIVDVNRRRFLDRWGAWLERRASDAVFEPPTLGARGR